MRLLPNNRDHGWAPYFWLVFLAFFFLQPAFEHAGRRQWLVTIVATVVFLVVYFGTFWAKPPLTYVLITSMALMGFGLAPINQGSSVFIIFAASFTVWVFQTPKRAFLGLLALLTSIGIYALLFHPPLSFVITSVVVSLGVGGS